MRALAIRNKISATKTTDPHERFMSKVVKRPDGCWEWKGRSRAGYPQFDVGRRGTPNRTAKQAHRWIYEWTYGPIEDGREAAHTCERRWCVNPDHVQPQTIEQNRAGERRCPNCGYHWSDR